MGRDDKARLRILEAYERAKKVNPSITQGQFMLAGAPGSRVEGLAGKFKSDESASRYFRKIRSGERTGGAMYQQGREEHNLGSFQFRVKLRDRYISQNVAMEGGSSTFDIAAIEYELKHNERAKVEAIIAKYRSKYGMEAYDPTDLETLEVKTIKRSNTPYRIWGSIGDYGF